MLKSLAFLFLIGFSWVVGEPSYGELARTYIPDKWNTAMGYMSQFTETVSPGDSIVKSLRKSLLYTRDLLDIFVYAYPNTTSKAIAEEPLIKGTDAWVKLRDDLDEGYTALGEFQDLNKTKVSYTTKELNKRRGVCLNWQQSFSKRNTTYQTYILNPSTTALFIRSSDSLSQFYWGIADITPALTRTGLANIAFLVQSILNRAISDLPKVTALKDLYSNEEYHLVFHDYRKTLRAVLDVKSYFPNVFRSGPCQKGAEGLVSNLFDQFGKLNDELNAYEFYVKANDKKKEEDKKKGL